MLCKRSAAWCIILNNLQYATFIPPIRAQQQSPAQSLPSLSVCSVSLLALMLLPQRMAASLHQPWRQKHSCHVWGINSMSKGFKALIVLSIRRTFWLLDEKLAADVCFSLGLLLRGVEDATMGHIHKYKHLYLLYLNTSSDQSILRKFNWTFALKLRCFSIDKGSVWASLSSVFSPHWSFLS